MTWRNAFFGLLAVVAFTGSGLAEGAGRRLGLIDGKRIKPASISGNRLKADTLTGRQIKESTLGPVPHAAVADRALTADHATAADHAGTATRADSAASADSAGSATTATSADDAATIGGRHVIGLTGDLPTGATDQEIGRIGPFTFLGSCGSGASNQAVTFKVRTSADTAVRLASRQAFPDQVNGMTAPAQAANTTVTIVNALFEYVEGGFTLTSGGRTYSGSFTANYSSNGSGCMIAGTVIG